MMKTLEKISARNKDAWNQPVVSVACLGDSVTHGCFEVFMNRFGQIDTRYRPDRGYAAQLRRRLDALYPAAAEKRVRVRASSRASRSICGESSARVTCRPP